MDTITTTQLRTKSSDLVETLLYGQSVDLIHRSRVIGEIRPKNGIEKKAFNAKELKEIIKKLNLKSLTPDEMEKRYREAMIKKHGKYLL